MGHRTAGVHWQIFEHPEQVACQAAERILAAANRAIAGRRGRFHLVLAGGGTPQRTYQRLTTADTDWSRWSIYFGDERCLPADHRQRNSRMAAESLLDAVPIAAGNVNVIPAELGAEAAAAAYRRLVRQALPFDLVLLGIGEDGHIASLFPGRHYPDGELVHAVHDAPKPPPDRVSLSVGALSATRQLMVLATGAAKRPAVAAWRAGQPLPVAAVRAKERIDVLLDRSAAGQPEDHRHHLA